MRYVSFIAVGVCVCLSGCSDTCNAGFNPKGKVSGSSTEIRAPEWVVGQQWAVYYEVNDDHKYEHADLVPPGRIPGRPNLADRYRVTYTVRGITDTSDKRHVVVSFEAKEKGVSGELVYEKEPLRLVHCNATVNGKAISVESEAKAGGVFAFSIYPAYTLPVIIHFPVFPLVLANEPGKEDDAGYHQEVCRVCYAELVQGRCSGNPRACACEGYLTAIGRKGDIVRGMLWDGCSQAWEPGLPWWRYAVVETRDRSIRGWLLRDEKKVDGLPQGNVDGASSTQGREEEPGQK